MLYVAYGTVWYCSERHSDAAAAAAACCCCCRVAGGRIERAHPLILLSSCVVPLASLTRSPKKRVCSVTAVQRQCSCYSRATSAGWFRNSPPTHFPVSQSSSCCRLRGSPNTRLRVFRVWCVGTMLTPCRDGLPNSVMWRGFHLAHGPKSILPTLF